MSAAPSGAAFCVCVSTFIAALVRVCPRVTRNKAAITWYGCVEITAAISLREHERAGIKAAISESEHERLRRHNKVCKSESDRI